MPLDEGKTPAMAYARKMPQGVTVTDEPSGTSCRREWGEGCAIAILHTKTGDDYRIRLCTTPTKKA